MRIYVNCIAQDPITKCLVSTDDDDVVKEYFWVIQKKKKTMMTRKRFQTSDRT